MNINEDVNAASAGNPFRHTGRISFELSNICNYALIHTKCPLNLKSEFHTLSKKIVVSVLVLLKKYDFSGMISFHNYNEPGIDPRLMLFINLTKDYCPKAKIFLLTNGFYLDQNMLEEYEEAGVDSMHISAYSRDEHKRLSGLKPGRMRLTVEIMTFDTRLDNYNGPEKRCIAPCHAPLNEIIINNKADVALCCWDWKYKYTFGNLNTQQLEEILRSEKVLNVYKDLSNGIRSFDICRRCGVSR